MEHPPKRRLIIRKKQVSAELDESLLPPTTTKPYGHNCTSTLVTEPTKKKCPCGGEYTSDSEYTPRECCSCLYASDVRYTWVRGRYTPDYTPMEYYEDTQNNQAKQNFYSGFCKPVVYDFSSDKEVVSTTLETKKTSSFSILPANQLRSNQRDYREGREGRTTQRDYRESREGRTTQRDYRESREGRDHHRESRTTQQHYRESRTTQRDYRESREGREHHRDRDHHHNRERDYERPRRHTDEPNGHNGSRREPSKLKTGLDSEIDKYTRKF